MRRHAVAVFLIILAMGISEAWSVDGVCNASDAGMKTLVDFTNMSTNITYETIIGGLMWETHSEGYECSNITFVNSSGVGMEINFSCFAELGMIGEYPIFNKKNSWYECEAVGWDSEINPACDSENKLVHYFNESDWKDYDFVVFEYDDSLDGKVERNTSFYGWRGESIFGDAQENDDKFYWTDVATERFYTQRFIGLYDDSDNRLYLPLTTGVYSGANDYRYIDSEGATYRAYLNTSGFLNFADGKKYIATRLHYDVEEKSLILGDVSEDFEKFVLKKIYLLRKESHLVSPDCAVPLSIEELTKGNYKYMGWIVNVTGYRIPTNFQVLDTANDAMQIMWLELYGVLNVPRFATMGIADDDGWFLPVGNLWGDFGLLCNTSMWERITITGKMLQGMPLYEIFEVYRTGDTKQIAYEEIPDYWSYMKDNADFVAFGAYTFNFENLGCRFSKILLKKNDIWYDSINVPEYNYSVIDLFSVEDYCESGYGCYISTYFPFESNTTLEDSYDLIMLGGSCLSRDEASLFYPTGIAFDELGFVDNGICELGFEYYKDGFEDRACRIIPTFYSLYLGDASAKFYPVIAGITGVLIVAMSMLLFSGKMEIKWYLLIVGIIVLSAFVYYTLVDKGLVAV